MPGCAPSGSAGLLPQQQRHADPAGLAALRDRHPSLEICLIEAEPPQAAALLGRGDCDLAVSFDYPAMPAEENAADDGATVPLLVDPLIAVLPVSHPLAAGDRVRLGRPGR